MDPIVFWSALGSNIVVGLLSGWIGGKLGVIRALEKQRGERAFDRRLDWHIRVIRAMKQFQAGMREYIIAAIEYSPEEAKKTAQKAERMMSRYMKCVEEALLFTDRESIVSLKTAAKEFSGIMRTAREAKESGQSKEKILYLLVGVNKTVGNAEFKLIGSLREQLGLGPVKAEDL